MDHASAFHLFGVTWFGVNAQNIHRLVFSLALLAAVFTVAWLLGLLARRVMRGSPRLDHVRFWSRQVIRLLATAIVILGLLSIWFGDPTHAATAFGLVSAGLAFALQRVITSIAGYFVILRSSYFTVGDRISMGGVRGDVMALDFIQTTIMEMGQPESVGGNGSWVKSRQFTGRIVTVSNAKIFDDPVYNYTREFPFIWEEIMIPITYTADRARAEAILIEAARAHAVSASVSEAEKADIQERFGIAPIDLEPTVYMRLTDNWLELACRFLLPTHGIRQRKSDMSRQIIAGLDAHGIGIASSTYDIVGFPPIRMAPSSSANSAVS